MEAKNAPENEAGKKLLTLQRENLEGAAVQAGLDLKNYEAAAKKRLGGLMDLSPKLLAEQHAALPEVDATVKSLVPRSRKIMREQDWVAYKPDPFGPVDVFTEGPFQDFGAPPPLTARLCRVVSTTMLDTSANHGASVSQVVTGSEDAATLTENFDATPGVNQGHFTFGLAGSQMLEVHDIIFGAGFRFNFTPTVTGEYRVRPVAILNGAWQLLASSDPLFTTAASIEVRFATRTIQDSGQGGSNFFHNVLLADASVNGTDDTGSFFYQTATADDPGAASGEFVQDVQARISVVCSVRLKVIGPSAALLDADQPKLFLRVPEFHVDQLDCSSRIILDDHFPELPKERPTAPGIPIGPPGS